MDPQPASLRCRQCNIDSATQMEALGAKLASNLAESALIFLYGDLGAGKTTLVRGLLRALGHKGPVKSPTFTLVEPYDVDGRCIYHIDLYRLAAPEEFDAFGGRDLIAEKAVCLVEWPEQAKGELGDPDLEIRIEYAGNGRAVELRALTEFGTEMLMP